MLDFPHVPLCIPYTKFDDSEDSSDAIYAFPIVVTANYVASSDERYGYDDAHPHWNVTPFLIDVNDLDRRVAAMIDILCNKRANVRYNRNQAIALANKCIKKGRQDLADKLYVNIP